MIEKKNNPVDANVLGGWIEKLLNRAVPAPVVSLIAGKFRREEWAHSLEFPDGGGVFIVGRGEINGFVRTVTEAGCGHPELVSSLRAGEPFYLCPIKTASDRRLAYDPVSRTEVYYLEWSALIDLLQGEEGGAGTIRGLLTEALSRLAAGLASSAAHLPGDGSEPVPELPPPDIPSPDQGPDFSGTPPVSLAAGESWSDPTAAGAFISRGRVEVAEAKTAKSFCARGPGLQATGGSLLLKAQSAAILHPIPRVDLVEGKGVAGRRRLLVVELACSFASLGGPLATALTQSARKRFQEYLLGARSREKADRVAAVETVASIQKCRRALPFIFASSAAEAWVASIQMIAAYEGLPASGKGKAIPDPDGPDKDPVFPLAKNYGMFARRLTIPPGSLSRLGSPIIAVQKTQTPLVLEPVGRLILAHDPLRGSRRVAPGDLEPELTGRAYELIPDLPPPPLGPKRFIALALAHLGSNVKHVIGASLAVTLLGMFTPVATGWIFGRAIPSSQTGMLAAIGLALMAAALAAALFSLFRTMIEINFEAMADTRLASMLMSRLLRLPVGFFRKYSIGDLSMRFRAVLQIRQLLTSSVLNIGLNGGFSLFYLFLMFSYSAQLAWYGLGLGVLAGLIMAVIFKSVSRRQRAMLARRAKQQSVLYELINGILVVRSSGAGRTLYHRWLGSFGREMEMFFTSSRAQMWSPILYGGFPILGTLVMFLFGGQEILAGNLRLSGFLAYISAFSVFFLGLIGACQAAVSITLIRPLWERARPLIDAEEENVGDKAEPGRLSGRIELRDCSFRYRPEDPPVIQDISLTVQPGEFVAITGPSGAGKSTLIRLLIGFEAPQRGAIFYDSYDLKELDLSRLRRQIGVVLQENKLVPGSIRTNLAVNAPLASMDEIVEAAQEADIHRDIMQMPMRYETFVSEGGMTFSGGQCQRLAIARALVPRPKILFFDEATSSLDNVSQKIVEESLDKLSATRIVVAHRLSTIQKANRIFVLDRGRVVQEGTFDDLQNRDGLFQRMMERQLL